MKNSIKEYLSQIGEKGGCKSRRILSSLDAENMVKVREARRAYKKFYANCFWSYKPDLKIGIHDVPWVASQLKKNGGRETWLIGNKLCP